VVALPAWAKRQSPLTMAKMNRPLAASDGVIAIVDRTW